MITKDFYQWFLEQVRVGLYPAEVSDRFLISLYKQPSEVVRRTADRLDSIIDSYVRDTGAENPDVVDRHAVATDLIRWLTLQLLPEIILACAVPKRRPRPERKSA